MLPIAVFPLHDKDGSMFSHLQKITPDLKKIFEKVFVSITPPTLKLQKGSVESLSKNPFFEVVYNSPETQVGDHFLAGFKTASEKSNQNQLLHLCTVDRLAYILETKHKKEFLNDVSWAEKQNGPVLFQRSAQAWSTHPQNYYALESAPTRVGEILFEKTLDFTWCHLVIKANELRQILPKFQMHDLTILTEAVLFLKDKLLTKNVDWLAWEDPFIFNKDQKKYKKERENDPEENKKRLSYVIPAIYILLSFGFDSG